MKNARLAGVLLLALGLAAPPQASAVVFRIGDTVYVDGKQYSWEQWKRIRERYQPEAARERAAASASAPRAASCVTDIYYSEFPSEDERFRCSGALGAMTREEILRGGWKIDLIEKIPAPAGVSSPPGSGALYKYKLVLSCQDSCSAAAPKPTPEETPAIGPAPRVQHDNLCVEDCLGNGGTHEFCQGRCAD